MVDHMLGAFWAAMASSKAGRAVRRYVVVFGGPHQRGGRMSFDREYFVMSVQG
jgi:hypothetical protein